MGVDRPVYQVVFLVDLWQAEHTVLDSELCLSVFRILTYLLSKIQDRSEKNEKSLNKTCQKIRWGCKFFNSRGHKGKIERSQFKSFKLKHFNVFEKEVEKRFRNTPDENKGKDYKETTDTSFDDSRKRRTSHGYMPKPSSPADNVGKVLSEVFSDFQWEKPDLMSPGRPHRRKSRPARWGRTGLNSSKDETQSGSTILRNLLFVFSSCPHTEETLKTFCGKKCIDGDVFLDSVLSTSMLDKLRGSLSLDLFWVDTHSNYQKKAVDDKSISKVSDALRKVGGRLIPIEAIIQDRCGFMLSTFSWRFSSKQCVTPANNRLQEVKEEQGYLLPTNVCQIIPPSSSLDYYLQSPLHFVQNKRRSVEKNPEPVTPDFAGQLFIANGQEEIPVCKLRLQTTLNHNQWWETMDQGLKNETVSECSKKKPQNDDATDCKRWSCSHQASSLALGDLLKRFKFTVIGAVQLQTGVTAVISKGISFVCLGDESESSLGGSTTNTSSTSFQNLLDEILREQKVLMISLTPGKMVCEQQPWFAILQPLTAVSGQLTLLSNSLVLDVEKRLLMPHDSPLLRDTVSNQGFDEWRNRFINSRLTSSLKTKATQLPSVKQEKCVQPFNSCVLERWFPSGQSGRVAALVQKLADRVESLDFLAADEKSLLKKVQKLYRRENQPMLQSQYEESERQANLVRLNGGKDEALDNDKPPDDIDEVDGTVGKIVFLEKLRSNSKIISGSRSEKMVKSGIQKSKKSSTTTGEDEEKQSKRRRQKPDVGAGDFKSETELVEYLGAIYKRTVLEEDSVDTCVQSIVMVALHFLKQSGAHNPEEQLKVFLHEKLLKGNSQLRQTHSSADCVLTEDQKLLEYKLQVQLQFEVATTQAEVDSMDEDTIEEVCNMLRKWSLSGKLDIRRYLEEVLVENYIHTLPRSLGNLYSSLMLPMPDELAKVVPRGDHSSLDDSCFSDTLISPGSSVGPGSVAPRSNSSSISLQPPSNRSDILTSATFKTQKSRKLVVHPSLSDIGPKRQIMVAVNPAQRKQTKSKRSRGPGSARKGSAKKGSARKSSARKNSARKKKKEECETDVKAVRRNLFMSDTKLERRQSVAVMENLKSPRRRRGQKRSALCSPSPRGKVDGPNLVAETPAHKQMSAVLRRQSREKGAAGSAPVVAESPLKPSISPAPTNSALRFRGAKSPARSQISVMAAKRNFYSAGPQSRSRNLEKYRLLADRIAGRTPTGPGQLKSPDRLFVVKQLKGSPSPSYSLRRTPQKLDKTPQKAVLDSPCHNTRSKTPSTAAGVPDLILYRDSPKSTGKTKESVTRKLSLCLTPEKAPSGTGQKADVVIPSTPVTGGKCSSLGTPSRVQITCMDSPSRNTRSQFQIKPSAGIRSLDFSSVATDANPNTVSIIQSTPVKQSPVQPCDKTPQKTPTTPSHMVMTTPSRSARKCSQGDRLTPPTPASILKKRPNTQDGLVTPKKPAMTVRWQEDDLVLMYSNKNGNVKVVKTPTKSPKRTLETPLTAGMDSGVVNEPSISLKKTAPVKAPGDARTPTKSPRKTKVRTPDFDSWHRRKPRFSMSTSPRCIAAPSTSPIALSKNSPQRNKSPSSSCNSTPDESQTSAKKKRRSWKPKVDKSQPKIYDGRQIRAQPRQEGCGNTSSQFKPVKISRNPFTKSAENLHSQPGESVKSPIRWEESHSNSVYTKRKRRIPDDFTESDMTVAKKVCTSGPEAFLTTDTVKCSVKVKPKTDYFSAANEDVFLSGNQSTVLVSSPDKSDISSSSTSTSPFKPENSPKFSKMQSLGKFSESLSSESDAGFEPTETNSPIFSPNSSDTSANSSRQSTDASTSSRQSSENTTATSPTLGIDKKSVSPPHLKTFSPNVSAKGLFNLMNSPLIRSGQNKRLRSSPDCSDDVYSVVRFTADSSGAPNKKRKVVARSRRSLNLMK